MTIRNFAVLSLPAAAMAYDPQAWLIGRQEANACTTTVTYPAVTTTSTAIPTIWTPDAVESTGSTSTGNGVIETTITATVTNCDENNEITSTAPVATSSVTAPPEPFTTVYTTVYETVCETGIETVTYTITKTCSEACHHEVTEIPPGFTTTVATITGDVDVTTTLTVPCETTAPPSLLPVTSQDNGIYTTFTTEYPSVCPTGIVTHIYTVTQHCGDEHCTRPTDTLPDGFTSTVMECTAGCGEGTKTLTVTIPTCPTCHGQPASETGAQPTTIVPTAQITTGTGSVSSSAVPLSTGGTSSSKATSSGESSSSVSESSTLTTPTPLDAMTSGAGIRGIQTIVAAISLAVAIWNIVI